MDDYQFPSGINPYDVLDITSKDSIESIKVAYLKMALKTHPDKGGDADLFNLVKYSYKFCRKLKEKELGKRNKSYKDVKRKYNDFIKKQKKETSKSKPVIFDKNNFNNKKFNNVFNHYKIEDYNSSGYGNLMDSSSKVREDSGLLLDRAKKRNKKNDFNKRKSIVKYKHPKAISISKQQYYELGKDKEDDFSSNTNSDIAYTDYVVAHSDPVEISNNRKKYESYDELKKDRNTANFDMTDEEKEQLRQLQILQEEDNQKRRVRINNQDSYITKRYNQMDNMIKFSDEV